MIETLRRELFDHVIVFDEQHLKRLMLSYLESVKNELRPAFQRLLHDLKSERDWSTILMVDIGDRCRRDMVSDIGERPLNTTIPQS